MVKLITPFPDSTGVVAKILVLVSEAVNWGLLYCFILRHGRFTGWLRLVALCAISAFAGALVMVTGLFVGAALLAKASLSVLPVALWTKGAVLLRTSLLLLGGVFVARFVVNILLLFVWAFFTRPAELKKDSMSIL